MTEWTATEITALRQSLGLSEREFAALLGCDYTQVWRWERGKARPSVAYRRELWRVAYKALDQMVEQEILGAT